MSIWYWLGWLVLSVANAALLICSIRNLRAFQRLLAEWEATR